MFGFHDWDDVAWRLVGLPVDQFHRQPAVMEATWHKHLPMLRLLLTAGADPNASDGTGSTALWTAVDNHDRESVRLLLLAGADPNARWKDNSTILSNLPDQPDPKIVAMLKQAGAGY
jgi:ankyrin repeat protein